MEEKTTKSCKNCINNQLGVCTYIRDNFLIMTRVLDKGMDVGYKFQLDSAITITDNASKTFCCNNWKEKKKKEEKEEE